MSLESILQRAKGDLDVFNSDKFSPMTLFHLGAFHAELQRMERELEAQVRASQQKFSEAVQALQEDLRKRIEPVAPPEVPVSEPSAIVPDAAPVEPSPTPEVLQTTDSAEGRDVA